MYKRQHTYLVAWKFIQEVLFIPEHWSHFGLVLNEAARRGIDGGPGLVWGLIVLPLALPALLIALVGLCMASWRAHPAN